MKVPVFRALDRTNKFLGIKGSYLIYAVIAMAFCLLIGVSVGVLIGSGAGGMLIFLILAAIAYVYLISFQAKHDEKERDQMIASLKMPDIIRVKPIPIYKMFKYKFKIK